MTTTISEIKTFLINYINNADDQEIIAVYENLKNVKITDEGDSYFPYYVETKK